MISLPPALQPWRATLAVLPPEVGGAIGPWLARLARTVGPLRRSRATDDGPPDGFSGLGRRGPYERLVMTEWLLAEALPEEFVRRAAQKEHLFLQLARQEPTGSLRSVVLFDAGPSQLGGPRLIHLAALVIFAQRALDAGADLRFGVLQSEPAPLAEFNASTVERVMHARSGRPPTLYDWQDWLAAITPAESEPADDDVWVVGGPDVRPWATAAGAGHLLTKDVVAPDTRAVQVSLHRGPQTRALTLDLPPARACVRLLRDPYEQRPVVPVSLPAVRALGMRFTWDARHLLIRTPDGLSALRVPRHRGDYGGTSRHLAIEEGEILAADNYQRSFVVLVATADSIVLQYFSRRGAPNGRIDINDNPHFARPSAEHRIGPLIPLRLRKHRSPRLLTGDAANSAFLLRADGVGELVGPLFRAVQTTRHRGRVYALIVDDDENHLNLNTVHADGKVGFPRRIEAIAPGQAHFGVDGGQQLTAVRFAVGAWTFVDRADVIADNNALVVGTVMHAFRGLPPMPALVSLADDRRSVVILGPGSLTDRVGLPFEIREAVVAPEHPLIAVRSEQGAVHVVHLDDFSVVARCQP